MDLGLKGKKALVCGASDGLGRACAESLAAEGVDLVICARTKPKLQETAEFLQKRYGVNVLAQPADLSVASELHLLTEIVETAFAGLDILVTNTGGPPAGSANEITDEMWRKGFELTFLSVTRLVSDLAPLMIQNRWGRIINLTSVSVREPIAGLILSNAVRAAVVGFAKALSRELAPYGILVNNIVTGSFDTARLRSLLTSRAGTPGIELDKVYKQACAEIPLGRLGKTEELANLVTFLASEKASYITGTSIPVDGGMLHGLW